MSFLIMIAIRYKDVGLLFNQACQLMIHIKCRNYKSPFEALNTDDDDPGRRLRFGPLSVFRAIVTVGLQKASIKDILEPPRFLYRFGSGLSAISFLEIRKDVGLCLSDSFDKLNSAEKSNLSHWYGMAFAKLVADSEFGIRNLGFSDEMERSGALNRSSKSQRRPDFVGSGVGDNWHILEAKGRSGITEVSEDLIHSAKEQATTVSSVQGKPPATASAVIVLLSTKPISIFMEDPTPEEGNDMWSIDSETFLATYYQPIIDWLHIVPTREEYFQGLKFTTGRLFPYWERNRKISIGLESRIFQSPRNAGDYLSDLPERSSDKLGSDGIAIFGSQSLNLMNTE